MDVLAFIQDNILWIILGIIVLAIIICAFVANFAYDNYVKALHENIEIKSSYDGTAKMFAKYLSLAFFGGSIKIQEDSQILSEGQYNPSELTVTIKDTIAHTNSVAGVAIIAHEFGHALQHVKNPEILVKNYKYSRFVKFLGGLNWVIILGAVALTIWQGGFTWGLVGVGLLLLNTIIAIGLKLSTLKLEKNASDEAMKMLRKMPNFSDEELAYIKRFLNYAKRTYTADFLCALLGWTGLVRRTKYF